MKRALVLSLAFCFLAVSTCQDDGYYTAAVVEYAPKKTENESVEQILKNNVERYVEILKSVADKKIDIIVYPEGTLAAIFDAITEDDMIKLSTNVPKQSEKIIPCDDKENDYPDFFKKLSCAAKDYQTYMVVNLKEKINCTIDLQEQNDKTRQCARHGYNLYNTNVAFDRKGTVVARYRKYNLFGEFYLNTTLKPETVTFATDFGVKFGLFTCFDLLFSHPALDLIENGVQHIVFPTYWFSELPFLTALQAQQSFMQANNVAFLSAGANNIESGSGGTGIFQGRYGQIDYDYMIGGDSKVIVAKVSKILKSPREGDEVAVVTSTDNDKLAEEMDKFHLIRDNIDVYSHKQLNVSDHDGSVDEKVCHKETNGTQELCCHFSVEFTINKTNPNNLDKRYHYQMVAFTGVRSFTGMYNGGVEHCAIIACLNETLQSCAYRFPNHKEVFWPVTFTHIEVSANYSVGDRFQAPTSLLSSIRPIHPNETTWRGRRLFIQEDKTDVIERTYELVKPQNRLLTFGIHGRDFTRDSKPGDKGGASARTLTATVLLISLALLKIT